jgi:hypothetical protein
MAVVEAVLKLQQSGLAPVPRSQHDVSERARQESAAAPPDRSSGLARQPASITPPPPVETTEVFELSDPEAEVVSAREPEKAQTPQDTSGESLSQEPRWDDSDSEPEGGVLREAAPDGIAASSGGGESGIPPLDWWLERWDAFLNSLRAQGGNGRILAARLRFCEPREVDGETLVLGFFYSIHRDKIEEVETRRAVENALGAFCGRRRVSLRCELAPKREATSPAKTKYEEAAEDPIVRTALKLGGRIVDVRIPDQS